MFYFVSLYCTKTFSPTTEIQYFTKTQNNTPQILQLISVSYSWWIQLKFYFKLDRLKYASVAEERKNMHFIDSYTGILFPFFLINHSGDFSCKCKRSSDQAKDCRQIESWRRQIRVVWLGSGSIRITARETIVRTLFQRRPAGFASIINSSTTGICHKWVTLTQNLCRISIVIESIGNIIVRLGRL